MVRTVRARCDSAADGPMATGSRSLLPRAAMAAVRMVRRQLALRAHFPSENHPPPLLSPPSLLTRLRECARLGHAGLGAEAQELRRPGRTRDVQLDDPQVASIVIITIASGLVIHGMKNNKLNNSINTVLLILVSRSETFIE